VKIAVRGPDLYVMAYCDGRSLAEALHSRSVLPDQGLAIVTRIAEALTHAHAQRILHGSVSPDSVILDAQGHPAARDGDAVTRESPARVFGAGDGLDDRGHTVESRRAAGGARTTCARTDRRGRADGLSPGRFVEARGDEKVSSTGTRRRAPGEPRGSPADDAGPAQPSQSWVPRGTCLAVDTPARRPSMHRCPPHTQPTGGPPRPAASGTLPKALRPRRGVTTRRAISRDQPSLATEKKDTGTASARREPRDSPSSAGAEITATRGGSQAPRQTLTASA
jgi:serine/threonine protein kinase